MPAGIHPAALLWHEPAMIPQFYLVTPPIEDAPAFRPSLEALIGTGVFSVMKLRFAGGENELKRKAGALVSLVQEAGIACLVDLPAEPGLVSRLGLDGAHVSGLAALGDAIKAIKPAGIVGVGGLKSRHDAMEAGERDIDYVMFGEPRADGSLPALEQTIERSAWWSEIFNLPCIAYAPDLASVGPLAVTGCEFVALGPWLFMADDPADQAAEARRIAKAQALERTAPG